MRRIGVGLAGMKTFLVFSINRLAIFSESFCVRQIITEDPSSSKRRCG